MVYSVRGPRTRCMLLSMNILVLLCLLLYLIVGNDVCHLKVMHVAVVLHFEKQNKMAGRKDPPQG